MPCCGNVTWLYFMYCLNLENESTLLFNYIVHVCVCCLRTVSVLGMKNDSSLSPDHKYGFPILQVNFVGFSGVCRFVAAVGTYTNITNIDLCCFIFYCVSILSDYQILVIVSLMFSFHLTIHNKNKNYMLMHASANHYRCTCHVDVVVRLV